jgi:hypothetical protein
MFSTTSRYYNVPTAELTGPDGRKIIYVRRRFISVVPTDSVQTEHAVTEGERLDNITARYLGDAEQFWRIADANNAMQPEALTDEIGRRLLIPLQQGG